MSKKQAELKFKAKQRKDYTFICSVIILILAIAQYLNTLGHDYAWDDAIVIRDNTYTQDGIGSLKEIWTKQVYIPQRKIYRPIPQTTFALEKHFFPEGNPKVGHFINILFYAFCCFLLFHFFKRLLPRYHLIFAFLASLLFLVHPIHTEVVANIKSRDEIIAMCFGLASMIFFLKVLSEKRNILIIPCVLFFIMACLSKLNAITLLAVYPFLYYYTEADNKTIGTYHLLKKDLNPEKGGKPFLDIPVLYKGIIATGILAATAVTVYLHNELVVLICILMLAGILFINFKKIQPWDFIFIISILLITSFFFQLSYSTEFIIILFLIYCYENKHWNIKYFIPVSILLIPLFSINILLVTIAFIILYKNIGKWYKYLLLCYLLISFINFYYNNYPEGLTIIFTTIYCAFAHYKSVHKTLVIFSIVLFIFSALFKLTSNSPVTIKNPIVTNDVSNNGEHTKPLELSKINNSLIDEPRGIKQPTIAKIQLEYLKKMFYPHPLVHNYGYNMVTHINWKNPIAWISIFIYFLLFLYTLKKIPERDPIAFGIIFYIITLSVYSNIIIIAPDTMAERFLFFPSIGFSMGFIFLWAGITRANLNEKPASSSGNILFYSGITMVLVLGFFKTIDRNRDWKDNKTLATNTLPYTPNSALIHANYAGEWMHHYEIVSNSTDLQALGNAIGAAERALEIHPKYFNAMLDLGRMYLKSGDVSKAENIFKTSLVINPDHPTPNLNLGLIHYSKKQYPEGITSLEVVRKKVLQNEKKPILDEEGIQQMYLFLARCYFNNNQLDQATTTLEEASRKLPGNPNYFELLANMYASQSDFGKAVSYLEKANKITPDNPNILEKLAEWKSNLTQ